VDNHFPYRLYGGQQDNTSIRIENMAPGRNRITEQNWTYSAGGESAFLAFDPDNPRYVLGGSYLGTIEVLDQEAKASTKIMSAPIQYLGRDASDMRYRYNWNAPIIRSVHEPGTFYQGAQYLLRTKDMGQTWEEVSPDLTNNEKEKQGKGGGPYTNEAVGAENYGTLAYVIESPHESGCIWTGSDDGVVQITRNGGESWTNVTPNGLDECLINAIDVSPHDAATAYIATTRYKFNDYTPGLYKTSDYGKSWTNISSGIPYGAFTRVIREDNVKKDLLYAGTETGVYVSWDAGKNWLGLKLNMPVVPITDLLVKEGDLVVATAGRSFWILDDLTLLRQYDAGTKMFTLYQPQDAIIGNWRSPLNNSNPDFDGTDPFSGVNPANGVVIYYDLPEIDEDSTVTMEILDAEGHVVRQISSNKNKDFKEYPGGPPASPTLTKNRGLNRFVWDMRYPISNGTPTAYIEGSYRGHKVSPGTYSIRLIKGKDVAVANFEILKNKLYNLGDADYVDYHNTMTEMEDEYNAMTEMVNTIDNKRQQVEAVLSSLEGKKYKAVIKTGMDLVEKMTLWDSDMSQRKSKAYDDVENFPNKFLANYIFLINQTESDIPRVTQPSKDRRIELEIEWQVLESRGKEILEMDLVAYNKSLWELGVGAIH
jgi:photosystem II stability/assembly factor-like uncharacterized protein